MNPLTCDHPERIGFEGRVYCGKCGQLWALIDKVDRMKKFKAKLQSIAGSSAEIEMTPLKR